MKYSEGRPGKARMFPECKYDRKPAPLPSPPQSGDLRLSLFLPGGKLTLISSAWNITNPITSVNVNINCKQKYILCIIIIVSTYVEEKSNIRNISRMVNSNSKIVCFFCILLLTYLIFDNFLIVCQYCQLFSIVTLLIDFFQLLRN